MSITKTHSKNVSHLIYAVAITTVITSPDSGASQDDDSEWKVALGAGAIDISTPWKGADNQVALIPIIDIRKGNWHFNGDDLIGYHTQIDDSWSASLGIGFRDDGNDSDDLWLKDTKSHQVFDGYDTPDAETVVNYGITYGWISVGGSRDVSGNSDAYSAGLSAEIPIYQTGNQFSISTIASMNWYDSSYVNYYYGISGNQIDDSVGRVKYHTGDATNFSIGISASYQISDLWSVMGILSRTKLDDSIVDSPLIDSGYTDSAGFIFVRRF
jgi:outer membrane scaffolding protein for murein synthesis (MipA/OmpV family)